MWETLIWAVPVAVLIAGIYRPTGGLLVLAACLPLFGSPPGGPYLTALDAAAFAAILTAWVAGPARRSSLDWPVAAFVVVSLASMAPALYHPPAWNPSLLWGLLAALPEVESWHVLYTWRALLNLVLGGLLFVSVRRAFADRSLRPLGISFAIGVALVLALGLAELLGLDLHAYRAIGGPKWETRLHSVFFHSGWLSQYLVIVLPFAVAALTVRRGRSGVAGATLAIVALVAVFFTAQRGAWFAALVQLLVLAWLGRRWLGASRARLRVAGLVVLATLALGAGLLAVRPDLREPLVQRVKVGTHLGGRTAIWKASLEMAGERPVLGWGLGAFAPAYRSLGMERVAGEGWLTAHNQYLMLAAERGGLGLLSFGLVAAALATSLASRGRAGGSNEPGWATAIWVSAAGAAVYGLVQYLFFLKTIEWTCWILLGIAAREAPGRLPTVDRLARFAMLAAALLLPWRLTLVEAPPMPGDRSFGFHLSEGQGDEAFEWTTDRAARRIDWAGETLVLRLANGHPRPRAHPVAVVVRADGTEVVRTRLDGGWRELSVELGTPTAEILLLEIEAQPTFRPFSDYLDDPELPRSSDIRRLGVAVGSLRWVGAPD